MTFKKRANLASLAHHEAGHAVAAFFQRQAIKYVTITENEYFSGHVKHNPVQFARHGQFNSDPTGIHRAECFIVILLAGPLAQRKFAPRSHWRVAGGVSSSSIGSSEGTDFDRVGDLMLHLGGEDRKHSELYLKLLWRRAELLVGWRWKQIEAVAAELLDRRQLTAESVHEVILAS